MDAILQTDNLNGFVSLPFHSYNETFIKAVEYGAKEIVEYILHTQSVNIHYKDDYAFKYASDYNPDMFHILYEAHMHIPCEKHISELIDRLYFNMERRIIDPKHF